jgi:hypothetical protein
MNLSMRRAAANSPPPAIFKSEERQALATAIEGRNLAQKELDATNKALSEMQEVRFAGTAHRAVKAAREAVEAAKANAAVYITAKIAGSAGEPPMSVKDARAALQEAEDSLGAELAVEESLKAKLKAEEQSLFWAKDRVKQKVKDVVSADPSLRKLLVDFEEMKRMMVQRQNLLNFLILMIPHEFRHWHGTRSYRPNELQDETLPWRSALAELENNADAPLPS